LGHQLTRVDVLHKIRRHVAAFYYLNSVYYVQILISLFFFLNVFIVPSPYTI
jgi:hypothetical protein